MKKEEIKKGTKKKRNDKKFNKLIITMVIGLALILITIVVVFTVLAYVLPKNAGNMQLAKPIIYIYPEKEIELTIKVGYPNKLSCSYPTYNDGWKVLAKPDRTLIDMTTGRELYSLYWEGKGTIPTDMLDGFVVKGSDVKSFLEEKLEILGLTDKEAQEFIIYWLPKLQNNKYNYIRFASLDEINEYMPLEFSVMPDTVIRVLMQYKSFDYEIEVEEQKLDTPTREGFTVVEWGGTEIPLVNIKYMKK